MLKTIKITNMLKMLEMHLNIEISQNDKHSQHAQNALKLLQMLKIAKNAKIDQNALKY